ncbi:MAG: hypothetical protein SAJ12_02655 [Jaaginema sp. PMC 1079.18]|nr:hypothetical protein [Jaaginema sp. PMC 1080.18]MEC4849887.1 hypothetical protein [Jaaginema sp. PMC 1079.18]MEC4866845.1 hypothetical protein [Jaaginema sp. PMC 1078.18]
MSNAVEKTSETDSWIGARLVIYLGVTWGILSLSLFLFGAFSPGSEDSLWYLICTYVAELMPFLAAMLLCYRNWQSPKIASGRKVWLLLGLGTLAYFLADLLFGVWEVYWGLDPEISPADFFFTAFYLCLGAGMLLAVFSRRLNLGKGQWAILSAIAVFGISLALWLSLAKPVVSAEIPNTTIVPTEATTPPSQDAGLMIPLSPAPTITNEDLSAIPQWVISLQDYLLQFAAPINVFYIVCDVGLLIISVMLLLAFWGGAFSLSWRMIAAAALARYLADMWFKYAATLPTDYVSGGFLEVFFVFSGILFAIGAALEYDVSSRPRQRRRRTRKSTEAA